MIDAEVQVDSAAGSLEYQRGILFAAATRCCGRIGDTVLSSVKSILHDRGIVDKIISSDVPDLLLIRGEVYITLSDFELVNTTLE